MPARNTIKIYAADCYYHVYNRGVEKREIFLDEQDYSMFLHLLKLYLSPKELEEPLTRRDLVRARLAQSVGDEVKLVAFCLMPNHFHLLLKQSTKTGMIKLMRKLSTTYAMYFNDRYNRVGTLFQGPYKAIAIDTEPYLLHLSRYIHLNPIELTRRDLVSYDYSSYPYYLGRKSADWLDPTPILAYFESNKNPLLKNNSYGECGEDLSVDTADLLGNLALEEE